MNNTGFLRFSDALLTRTNLQRRFKVICGDLTPARAFPFTEHLPVKFFPNAFISFQSYSLMRTPDGLLHLLSLCCLETLYFRFLLDQNDHNDTFQHLHHALVMNALFHKIMLGFLRLLCGRDGARARARPAARTCTHKNNSNACAFVCMRVKIIICLY